MYFLLPAFTLALIVSAAAVIASWAVAKFAGTSTDAVALKLVPTIHLVFTVTVGIVMLGTSTDWALLYTVAYIVGAIPSLVTVALWILRQHRTQRSVEPAASRKMRT